jgi:hypothetical protein
LQILLFLILLYLQGHLQAAGGQVVQGRLPQQRSRPAHQGEDLGMFWVLVWFGLGCFGIKVLERKISVYFG